MSISIYYSESVLKEQEIKLALKVPKGNILSAGYISPEKEKEKRLEKHSGSNSKSRRSAVKGQPSWQRRYGGTMVNHSHASPNNAREGQ